MADLSAAFEGIGLEHSPRTQYYTLHIEYPAFHLLPEGAQLHLSPPQDCTRREKPRLGTYHLNPDNVSFSYRSPVKAAAGPVANTGNVAILQSGLDILGTTAGSKYLEGVSFRRPEGEVQHIFHLAGPWPTEVLPILTEYAINISEDDLTSLFALRGTAEPPPWIDLLHNLIYRRSDRAYLCVQQELRFQRPDLATEQDSLWVWDAEPSVSGLEMLVDRLKCQLEDGSVVPLSQYRLDPNTEEYTRVVLPCGHTGPLETSQITAMTAEDCVQASCNECHAPVFDGNERKAAMDHADRLERYMFYYAEVELIALDGPVPDTSREIDASVQEICSALEDALDGFQVPASVDPTALTFVNIPEVRVVLHVLQEELQKAGEVLHATPTSVLQDLETESFRTLTRCFNGEEDPVSPSLSRLVGLWLRRTVNLLSGVQGAVLESEVEDLSMQLGELQMSPN